MKKVKSNPPSQVQSDHKTSLRDPYLKNLCRYWRLQEDQEKTPLRPASVGDIMLPSDFLHIFPSPSWTIPKLRKTENGYFKSESVRASVVCDTKGAPFSSFGISQIMENICVFMDPFRRMNELSHSFKGQCAKSQRSHRYYQDCENFQRYLLEIQKS